MSEKQKNKKLIIIVSVVFVVVVGITVGVIAMIAGQESVDDILALGDKYMTELDYESAIREYKRAIEVDPMRADAYLKLADAYLEIGDRDSAIATLENGYDATGDEQILERLNELRGESNSNNDGTADTETVLLNANGGSVSADSKKVTVGEPYGELPMPTRDGYTFKGWYTEETGGTEVTESTPVTATSEQTLYAQWGANRYTVTFDANGGSVTPSTAMVTYDSTYGNLPSPTREGYTFEGWYTAPSGGTEITSSTKVSITSAQTLYAHWEEVIAEGITWSLEDGTLTIRGRGMMDNYSLESAPWYSDRDNIMKVIIQEGITSIGDGAFERCDNLTSITIPSSVTSIGDYAFLSCDSLTSIIIPSNLTSIGDYAFEWCDSLTTITIPSSVTSIGEYALNDCDSLTSINVENGNSHYCSIDGVLFNANKTELIQYPTGNKQAEYLIPSSVTRFGDDGAFAWCASLTTITIPSSVTSISADAFNLCFNLTAINVENGNSYYCSVDGVLFNANKTELIKYPIGNKQAEYSIPSSVTRIGEGAIAYSYNLTSIIIPSSVTSIGEDAFAVGESITSITIPSSVTSIGNYAFRSCFELNTIYYGGSAEQWAELSQYADVPDSAIVYCNSSGPEEQ